MATSHSVALFHPHIRKERERCLIRLIVFLQSSPAFVKKISLRFAFAFAAIRILFNFSETKRNEQNTQTVCGLCTVVGDRDAGRAAFLY